MGCRTSTIVTARWVLTAVPPLRERLASRSRPGIGPEGVQLHARGHQEDFAAIMARMKAAKPEVMKRQMDLLTARYDLSNRRPRA